MTYADLAEHVVELAFPDGPAREALTNIDASLLSAMVELQIDVPMLQSGNTQTYDQGSTFWRCGCTLKAFPFLNKVTRVEIIGPDGECCQISAFEQIRRTFECHINNCGKAELIPPPGSPDADGNYVAAPDTDWTEAEEPSKYWATVIGGVLWIYPHISSTRSLKLTYRGVKRTWVDADDLPDAWVIEDLLDPDIATYLKWRLVLIYGACDGPKLEQAAREWALVRRRMTTDEFRDEQNQIDLKNPCMINCRTTVFAV